MHYIFAGLNRINTLVHILWLKILYGKNFRCKSIGSIGSSCHFTIQDSGKILLGKNVGMRRRCEISASDKGTIELGDKVFLNNQCMIVAHDYISIGSETRFGPDVKVYDHDYDISNSEAFLKGTHKTTPIIVGNNCWIGAGVIILRGTELGDNCIVGAGSVLKGKFEDNTVIVQKRENKWRKV